MGDMPSGVSTMPISASVLSRQNYLRIRGEKSHYQCEQGPLRSPKYIGIKPVVVFLILS